MSSSPVAAKAKQSLPFEPTTLRVNIILPTHHLQTVSQLNLTYWFCDFLPTNFNLSFLFLGTGVHPSKVFLYNSIFFIHDFFFFYILSVSVDLDLLEQVDYLSVQTGSLIPVSPIVYPYSCLGSLTDFELYSELPKLSP